MATASNHYHQPHNDGLVESDHQNHSSDLSPLEQEVLDEYERLARNMKSLSTTITLLSKPPPPPSTTTGTDADPTSPRTSTGKALAQRPGTPPSLPASSIPPQLTIDVAEGLRLLERKVASVYTLMKASVYSIVLQQEDMGPDSEARPGAAGQEEDGEEESRIGDGRGRRKREGDGW